LLYKHDFPAGQYTVSFNVTAYNKRSIVRCFDSNGNVLTYSDVSVTGGTWNSFYKGFYVSDGVGTFTVPDTVDHFWLGIGVSNDERDNAVTLSKVMLELGSTASSWSPYENICPISGWTGCEVNRTGKNLLPTQQISKSGNLYYIGTSASDYYFFKKGTYAVSHSGTNAYMYWRKEGTDANNIIHSNVSTGTFTLNEDCRIRIWFYSTEANANFTDIQIELGSTATDYEPYQGETYSITFPSSAGTVYGGTLTVNKDGTGELVVDRANVDLGTLAWNADPNRPGVFYSASKNATAKVNGSVIADTYKWRTKGVPSASNLASANNSISLSPSYGGGYIYVVDISKATLTAAEYKNAVNGINCVYELATPVTYQFSAPIIRSLLGTNNVSSDTNDSNTIKYMKKG
jgi:hypothetical protein